MVQSEIISPAYSTAQKNRVHHAEWFMSQILIINCNNCVYDTQTNRWSPPPLLYSIPHWQTLNQAIGCLSEDILCVFLLLLFVALKQEILKLPLCRGSELAPLSSWTQPHQRLWQNCRVGAGWQRYQIWQWGWGCGCGICFTHQSTCGAIHKFHSHVIHFKYWL